MSKYQQQKDYSVQKVAQEPPIFPSVNGGQLKPGLIEYRVVDGRTVISKADYDKQLKELDDKVTEGNTIAANANAARTELQKNIHAVSGKLLVEPSKLSNGHYLLNLDAGTYFTPVGGCYVAGKFEPGHLHWLKAGDDVELFVDCGSGLVHQIGVK